MSLDNKTELTTKRLIKSVTRRLNDRSDVFIKADSVKRVVLELFDTMKDEFLSGNDVRTPIGVFKIKHNYAHKAFNMHTRTWIDVPDSTSLSYKPSISIKRRLKHIDTKPVKPKQNKMDPPVIPVSIPPGYIETSPVNVSEKDVNESQPSVKEDESLSEIEKFRRRMMKRYG